MAVFSLAIFSISKSDSVELPPALASDAQPVAFREQLRRRVPSSVYVASAELGAIGLVVSAATAQRPNSPPSPSLCPPSPFPCLLRERCSTRRG
jgi:hypothetical protein